MPATSFLALVAATLLLLGPDLAEHDRVDCLQVRRVGGERQMNGAPADFAVDRGAEVVFDVARAVNMLGVGRIALELGKDRGERLADEIGEQVEAPAMRHADDEFADAERAAATQDRFQRRHQGFGALDAEALGAGITAVEKALKGLRGRQDLQNFLFVGRRQLCIATPRLEFLLDPGALGRDLDVHVLDADLAAVGGSQDRDDLAQARALVAEDVVEEDLAVEIGLCEAIAAVIKLGIRPAPVEAERIEIGFEMPAHAIGTDQLQRADRVRGRLAQCCCIEGPRRRRAIAAWLHRKLIPRGRAQFGERQCLIVAQF